MRRLLLFLVLAAAGCAPTRPAPDASVSVTGTVTYRQRVALPPDAVLSVRLLDVSLADAPSVTLAEQTASTEGRQVPVPFALAVDAGRIDARHRYAVRAEIRDASGALRWTTDTTIPVLTRGAPSADVEVVLVQVPEGRGGPETGAAGLVGGVWRLIRITTPDGAATVPEAGQPLTIAFGADGRYTGRADCNAYGGTYTLDERGGIGLRPAAATLAACAPPSEGGTFLSALGQVERAGVSGERMALRGPGASLIFERAGDVGMAPQPTGETLTYACDGGAFTVRAKTGPGEIALWLPERFGGQYLVLGQVRAASGAKYQDGDMLFWTQGDGARLEVDGQSFDDCQRVR